MAGLKEEPEQGEEEERDWWVTLSIRRRHLGMLDGNKLWLLAEDGQYSRRGKVETVPALMMILMVMILRMMMMMILRKIMVMIMIMIMRMMMIMRTRMRMRMMITLMLMIGR